MERLLTVAFDFTPLLREDLPPPAQPWTGFARYNFIGGHIDGPSVPKELLAKLASDALLADGADLATYSLRDGPLGYRRLREGIAAALGRRAAMPTDPDQVLVVSGSLQALDLVNGALLAPGDTVVVEEASYGGAYVRLARCGVRQVPVAMDADGMRMDSLGEVLQSLAADGVRAKFIYTIPSVQNPTGSVMTCERRVALLDLARRFDVAIFEDDCYADLVWEGGRPPAIRALDDDGRVIYCGSFSKTVAPALRIGYLVADWPVMRHLLSLKTDAGTGALPQMVLARFLEQHFDAHVDDELLPLLKAKCEAMMEAVEREFGTSAEFPVPKGGLFLWVTLPDNVDTTALAAAALKEGVAINPGVEWAADPASGRPRMRLCFGHPSIQDIREGVAKLAEVCHREFGVPLRGGNVARG